MSRSAGEGGSAGVLVDRDGTLIRDIGHLSRIEQIEMLPHAAEALRLLRDAGLKIAIVTNQSAVGRGLVDEAGLREIHDEVSKRLAAGGASVDGIYYCPHHPTKALGAYRLLCDCRKPEVGLARQAAEALGLDLRRSYVIGDMGSDMELAARVGAQGILLGDGGGDAPYRTAADIREAAKMILEDLRAQRRNA